MKLPKRIKMAWKALTARHGMLSRIARLQMIQSVLSDPSVILQSIHDGKPSVIYDCASMEDFQILLSQDIENV